MATGTVRCLSSHPEELPDGRLFLPGDTAEVNLADPHIAARVAEGAFAVEHHHGGEDAAPAKAGRAAKETA